MTVRDLEAHFGAYFNEIQQCRASRCYWSLLHMLVAIPDICGVLESDDGESTGARYRDWCGRYFGSDTVFTAVDRYAVRCVVLHQGRTVSERGQYRSYSFMQPGANGSDLHRQVRDLGRNGRNLTIDVDRLADETVNAMRAWFSDVEANADVGRRVTQHIHWLARVGEASVPLPTASGVTIMIAPTTSSTGGFGRSTA